MISTEVAVCESCETPCSPTLYGKPANAADLDNFKLMGCEISEEIYSWYCKACDIYYK